jgi:hypothetical protein
VTIEHAEQAMRIEKVETIKAEPLDHFEGFVGASRWYLPGYSILTMLILDKPGFHYPKTKEFKAERSTILTAVC